VCDVYSSQYCPGYLWILGCSERGGLCGVHAHPDIVPSISGSWDIWQSGVVWSACSSQYHPGMVRVSLDHRILWQRGVRYCPGMVRVSLNPGTEGGCVEYMFIPVLPWDGQSIFGSRGTLTEGSCVECMFIPVLSWDGQMYLWHLRILCHSMASLDIPWTNHGLFTA